MVSQVSSMNMYTPNLNFLGSTNNNLNNYSQNNSIFNTENNYDNDFMKSTFDFDGYLQNFSSNPAITDDVSNSSPVVQNPSEQTVSASTQTMTENTPESDKPKSDLGKIVGFSAGLLAPIAPKIPELFKGKSFSEILKVSSSLKYSCPLLAFAGLGVGMLIDNCINSKNKSS